MIQRDVVLDAVHHRFHLHPIKAGPFRVERDPERLDLDDARVLCGIIQSRNCRGSLRETRGRSDGHVDGVEATRHRSDGIDATMST